MNKMDEQDKDEDFLYIALELCQCSLYDVIVRNPNRNSNIKNIGSPKLQIKTPVITVDFDIIPLDKNDISTHSKDCNCETCRHRKLKDTDGKP